MRRPLPKDSKEQKLKKRTPDPQPGSRGEELAQRPGLQTKLSKLYSEVENGFDNQGQRSDNNAKWWDIFNCVLNDQQYYNGNSQIYVPITADAIKARKTRFVNQIFPKSGRYVEVQTEDGKIPDATISLLEHYIRSAHLKDTVMPALMKCGDIEGQYTIYVDWTTRERHVAFKEEVPAAIEANLDPALETEDDILDAEFDEEDLDEEEAIGTLVSLPDPDETVIVIKEETVKVGFPTVEVISDNDILVLPATADSIDEALECGGSVTVLRRWTKDEIEDKIANGEIDEEAGNSLKLALSDKSQFHRRDTATQMVDAAGIKQDARGKHALVYETWTKLTYKGERRIYKIYFAGKDRFLSCRRNPYWSDKIPVISCPVDKVHGSFKGKSLVETIATTQYAANDAINEGMDSAAYAMLPIIMTDPEKNPRVGSMVLSLAAIWQTSPKDTQFAQFPQLWKDALEIVGACRAQIFQSLSVNPSAITQTTSSKKPSQADVANEQQVDIMTTADAVSTIEEGILTPMLHFMLELDHQFRDKEVTIYQHGVMGIKAKMERVPPTMLNTKHYVRWFGVEAARSAQQIQQQIAAANVLRGIPPQLYPGYELRLTPLIIQLVESAFGPNLAPLVFVDQRDRLTMDPYMENEMLLRGEDLPVLPLDNLAEHMQAHMEALQASGDPHGTIMVHLMRHRIAASQMPMQAEGVPGTPGGAGPGIPGQAGPGNPGMPRIGAQPAQATGGQGPPGMIAADNMQDPSMPPRM
jgi:hypothetical protein